MQKKRMALRVLPALALAWIVGLADLSSSEAPSARAADGKEAWGTIKGQVVWPGDVPEPVESNVDKDKKECLAKGKIFDETYEIDKKSKGLRYVFVWLTPVEADRELPIHPDLKAIKDKDVVVDQPCCKFEPHALALRAGQTLVVKNSSSVIHNFKYDGVLDSGNKVIPPRQELQIDLKADSRPIRATCSIHAWMGGWIRVYNHPYFAVTDKEGHFEIRNAPAGEFRLKVWHDSGWLDGVKGKDGRKITIPGGKETDLGKIEWKSE